MVNFVILCTDQQRADSLGCAGNREARTPNLDALAARGTRFTRHYTPNQICCPSRGTMITGLYPRHHGMTTNGRTLHDGLATLPGVLGRAGWDTHAVGKLHLQPIMAGVEHRMPESVPFWQAGLGRDWHGPYFGYRTVDFMIGESLLATEGGHYAAWLRNEHPDIVPLYQPDAALDGPLPDLDEAWVCAVPAELHYNTWIAERAVAFLERARPPFLLFVSSPDPHHPFSPPRPGRICFDPARMPLPDSAPGELEKLGALRRGAPRPRVDRQRRPRGRAGRDGRHRCGERREPAPRHCPHARHGGDDRRCLRQGARRARRAGARGGHGGGVHLGPRRVSSAGTDSCTRGRRPSATSTASPW